MNRKLRRTVLVFSMIAICAYIGGIFVNQILTTPFQANSARLMNPDNNEINNENLNNNLRERVWFVDDTCCGHVDTTPPVVYLISPGNGSIVLGGTIINMSVTDNNPMADFLAKQVVYHWEGELSNTTLVDPFEVTMPSTDGIHILYVYAEDDSGNWGLTKLQFAITSDTGSVSIIPVSSTTTTQAPRRSDGFLVLPVILVLIGIVTLIKRRKRK